MDAGYDDAGLSEWNPARLQREGEEWQTGAHRLALSLKLRS